MKLRFTEQAASQIEAISAHLVSLSPLGARNVQLAMGAALTQLAQFPRIGRRQRTAGVRKIGAGRYPYNIYYSVNEQSGEVIILSVRHTSRAPRFRDA